MPRGMELGVENRWRSFDSKHNCTASSHTSRALRPTGRRTEWQVSWGFRDKPVDWPDAEKTENRSLETLSLRTS